MERSRGRPIQCLPSARPQCQSRSDRRGRRQGMADKRTSVEALLPVELGPGRIKFAQGIKAGRWVFATGVMAQDFKTGMAADVVAEGLPHGGLPKREKEALRIYEHIDAVLRA